MSSYHFQRSLKNRLKRLCFPSPDDLNIPHWVRDELAYLFSTKHHETYEQLLRTYPPLVIGGTGGSGTRVLVSICEQAGYFPGTNLNRSNDSLDSVAWVRKWLPQVIMMNCQDDSSAPVRMARELNLMLMRQRRNIPTASHPWLIKNPRLMLALTFLHRQLPNMKFIHVVRDGRDIAFSNNQNQLRNYGHLLVADDVKDAPLPVRSIAFWAQTNLEVAEYGQTKMVNNYLRVRFEDLCSYPIKITSQILAFLNSDACADAMTACVGKPATIGRWRNRDASIVNQVVEQGRDALNFFRYIPD